MKTMNRRGLLGMFAAGVGAAILPSGVIMPVKPLILSGRGLPITFGVDHGLGDDMMIVARWMEEAPGGRMLFVEQRLTAEIVKGDVIKLATIPHGHKLVGSVNVTTGPVTMRLA